MRLARIVVAVVAVVGLVSACSGSSDGGGGGTGGGGGAGGGGGGAGGGLPQACSLVTKADAETAVGGTVAAGVEQPGGPNHYAFGQGHLCTFVPSKNTVSASTISVFRYSESGWAQYKQNQASFKTFQTISGVGEEAVSAGDSQIGLHQNGYVVDISLGYFIPHDPAGMPRLIALAKAAATRVSA